MARGAGDAEAHAVLLCNLLIGFGLDCYVAVGTNNEGAHAWVVERQIRPAKSRKEGRQYFTFLWESLHGTMVQPNDPTVGGFFKTVGCVFNHRSFYANLQAEDRVSKVSWDLDNERHWKAMDQSRIKAL